MRSGKTRLGMLSSSVEMAVLSDASGTTTIVWWPRCRRSWTTTSAIMASNSPNRRKMDSIVPKLRRLVCAWVSSFEVSPFTAAASSWSTTCTAAPFSTDCISSGVSSLVIFLCLQCAHISLSRCVLFDTYDNDAYAMLPLCGICPSAHRIFGMVSRSNASPTRKMSLISLNTTPTSKMRPFGPDRFVPKQGRSSPFEKVWIEQSKRN
jgi:hypothetical protein